MADRVVLDASALVAALLPDEPLHGAARAWLERFASGEVRIVAPTLLPYELANSLLTAERGTSRLPPDDVDAILRDIDNLGLELLPVAPAVAVAAARRYRCSAYDASYLGLADAEEIDVITADGRLLKTVGARCRRLRWVGADR
ncbi:MAG: type II toxin-antitoxin system VapC family toxin [Armatimonadota bacterium]